MATGDSTHPGPGTGHPMRLGLGHEPGGAAASTLIRKTCRLILGPGGGCDD